MEKALLLSGGMDSTTLLWWMRARGDDVHAISIDYNQRHRVELQWATALTGQLNIPHKTISLDLSTIGGSPLTDRALDVPSAASDEQISTVVPFRNMLFVTLAAAYAETQGMSELYLAPVRDDFTAYRDCRRPFYDSLEESLGLGATRETEFRLHTPFVEWWKVDVVKEGIAAVRALRKDAYLLRRSTSGLRSLRRLRRADCRFPGQRRVRSARIRGGHCVVVA